MNFRRVILLLCAALLLAGCQKPEVGEGTLPPEIETVEQAAPQRTWILPEMAPDADAEPAAPSYRELATKFNAHTDSVKHLWSRLEARVRYQVKDGKYKFEDGEGYLIARPPDHILLSLGKLGQTGLRAGRDAERYWFIDNQDRKEAVWGYERNIGKPCSGRLNLARASSLPARVAGVGADAAPGCGAACSASQDDARLCGRYVVRFWIALLAQPRDRSRCAD